MTDGLARLRKAAAPAQHHAARFGILRRHCLTRRSHPATRLPAGFCPVTSTTENLPRAEPTHDHDDLAQICLPCSELWFRGAKAAG